MVMGGWRWIDEYTGDATKTVVLSESNTMGNRIPKRIARSAAEPFPRSVAYSSRSHFFFAENVLFLSGQVRREWILFEKT